MICFSKIEKVVVFIMYLWVWWSAASIISSIHVIEANDSLKLGDTLNATTELCSKQSKYCMGFDSDPKLDSRNFTYLRMYSKEQDDWVVWIANRDQPVDRDSAVLTLNQSGVLKIESKIRPPIILYSSPQPLNSSSYAVATLLDTGNFVVQKIQVQPNGMKLKSAVLLLWQSFDYPTDCLIPGMKLGVNHKTGQNWSLVSYFSRYIATSGPFRLEWEPKRRELVIKHKEQVYWTSGKLRRNNSYKIVSNKDEEYLTLLTSRNKNEGLTIWTLLETGQLINRAGGDVARADLCYGYKTKEGCKKWGKLPNCRNVSVGFEIKPGYPDLKKVNDVGNGSYSINGCKFLLSMDGFNFASGGSNYYILVRNIHHNTGPGFPAVPNTHHKGTNKWIWISATAALLIICSSILCLAFKKPKYWLKEEKREKMEMTMLDLAASNESSCAKDLEDDLKEHDIKVFNYTSILEATLGFSPENKLGQGGYGPVYKGVLPTGQQVAVKRLSKTSGQGIMEFKNELTLISELQHTNLVQLLGCCVYEEEKILVYEYMPNKSLDFYLFDCTRSKILDWKKRFNIIEGISQGLLYLHKYSRLKVIHRDLKASNILLDENMNPKISDFGMARMFTQNEPAINTNRIVGTYGYMSPEYAMEGVFSTKSDVYSIGVLLLEIVSGRRNNSFYDDDCPRNLIGYAWELWKKGECLQLMDPSLNDTFIPDEVQRCIHVGLLCVEHYANDRPTMSNIISMLTNKNALVTLPRRPAFYFGTEILEETTTSMVSETYLSKEISTSFEVE